MIRKGKTDLTYVLSIKTQKGRTSKKTLKIPKNIAPSGTRTHNLQDATLSVRFEIRPNRSLARYHCDMSAFLSMSTALINTCTPPSVTCHMTQLNYIYALPEIQKKYSAPSIEFRIKTNPPKSNLTSRSLCEMLYGTIYPLNS